jgi:hypothetical protein
MAWCYFYGEWPGERFQGWRCMMCGEIIDPLILHHRLIQRGLVKIGSTEIKKNYGGGKAGVKSSLS